MALSSVRGGIVDQSQYIDIIDVGAESEEKDACRRHARAGCRCRCSVHCRADKIVAAVLELVWRGT